jgi:hypothetical protein
MGGGAAPRDHRFKNNIVSDGKDAKDAPATHTPRKIIPNETTTTTTTAGSEEDSLGFNEQEPTLARQHAHLIHGNGTRSEDLRRCGKSNTQIFV